MAARGKIILFDYDGVLVDSLERSFDAFKWACRTHDLKSRATMEEFLRLFEGNVYQRLREAGLSAKNEASFLRAWEQGLERSDSITRFFPGIPEMLRDLACGQMLGVVTSNSSEVVRQGFLLEGIDCIDLIIGAEREQSKVKKIRTVKFANLDSDVYYVGDTKGDIVEAAEAGAKTVAATWGFHSPEKLQEALPDFWTYSPQDLLALFEQ